MWKFFRLGIKGSSCSGNPNHFRIVGASFSNAENDDNQDEADTFGTIAEKENYESECFKRITLAQQATKKYANDFQHKVYTPYEVNPLKDTSNSLKNLLWKNCTKHKNTKVLKHSKGLEFGYKENKSNSKNDSERPKPLQNNENIFGELSSKREFDAFPDDPEDEADSMQSTFGNRLSQEQYGRKMLMLCKDRKLSEAIRVLEVEMPAQNVKPSVYCFNVLINSCGKAGYVRKAADLFHKMKQLGITPQKFAYTGVFNACANSPKKERELALKEARALRRLIKEQAIPVSPITYHAMIKAFGRCGDISTAFEIADDMLLDKHRITTETMNFLLLACVSDKETGFRHALMVWRRMRMMKLSPSPHSYNLLLQCVKECQAGDPALTSQILEAFPSSKSKIVQQDSNASSKNVNTTEPVKEQIRLLLQEGEHLGKLSEQNADATNQEESNEDFCHILPNNEKVAVNLAENMELELVNIDVPVAAKQENLLPDVLARRFSPGKVLAIKSLEKSSERLALLGGPAGVLKNMLSDKIEPNVAFFTLLVESLPPTLEAENCLLSSMENCGVKPDISFCNVLIKRRAVRNCLGEAKNVLDMLQDNSLVPDIVTYGCLAMTCANHEEGLQMLQDMEKLGVRPNVEIMGALIRRSFMMREYLFTVELLRKMTKLRINPNEAILNMLEDGRKGARKILLQEEKLLQGGEKTSHHKQRKLHEMRLFLLDYKSWLTKTRVDLPDHPWAQYGYVEKTSIAKVN